MCSSPTTATWQRIPAQGVDMGTYELDHRLQSTRDVEVEVRDGKLGCVQVNDRDRRFTEDQARECVEERTLNVRVDMKRPVSVSSASKKGGNNRAKSVEAQVTGSLVEELKTLCR